jgi:hypothetical protein
MSKLSFYKTGSFWQIIILSLVALVIWQIYYPGLMSPDSIAQYQQAQTGYFNDWHPPLMSIVLWVIMKLGGGISLLIFLQCLLALLGLRRLIYFSILFFSNQSVSKQNAGLTATIATILFLTPFLTPFMFFSVIFWKDAWIAVMLLWIVSYLIEMFFNFERLNKKNFAIYILLISVLSALMVLVRHNAFVILPAIGLIFAVLSVIKFGKKGLAAGILPLLFALILNPLVNNIFNIKPIFLGNEVLASDLVVLLKLYPELAPEYPLTARHQNSPILFGIDGGLTWDESTEGEPCPYIQCEEMPVVCYGTSTNTSNINGRNCYMPIGNDNKTLKAEFFKAVTTHPKELIHTKLYLFGWMIHPSGWWHQRVAYDIIDNPYGLKPNENFSGIRAALNELSWDTSNKWYFVWISGIHVFWIILNSLLVIYAIIRIYFKRDLKSVFLLFLLLIPLSYYFSYVLAAVAQDYRFMYPSTLIMQALVVSIIAAAVSKAFRKYTAKETIAE